VTISNGGRIPFTIKTVTLAAGSKLFPVDYKITQNSCLNTTLAVGASCTISTTFTPHGSGQRNGALQISTVQQGTATLIPHVVGLTGSAPTPTVIVNPGVVASGRVTTISGQGFAPNSTVTLKIPNLGDLTATTTPAGTFEAALLVFLHSAMGPREVQATLAGTTLKATAPLLVVGGTYQAPDFLNRR